MVADGIVNFSRYISPEIAAADCLKFRPRAPIFASRSAAISARGEMDCFGRAAFSLSPRHRADAARAVVVEKG
jgi:hypothetical protein